MSAQYTKEAMLSGTCAGWRNILNNSLLDKVVTALSTYEHTKISPAPSRVFAFAKYTPVNQTKVIIMGRDLISYKGNGLAFNHDKHAIKNIGNILISNELTDINSTNSSMEYWANQGVALINRTLTTMNGTHLAHKNIWRKYINMLIKDLSYTKMTLNNINYTPTFILWGNVNSSFKMIINPKCLVVGLVSEIYADVSDEDNVKCKGDFADCRNFIDVNIYLIKYGLEPIDWALDDMEDIRTKLKLTDIITTVVFTDGSCNPNKLCKESTGGYAAVFALGAFKNVALYGNIPNRPHYASNQRAEGFAILRVMQYLYKRLNKWDKCIIMTDSKFWISMIESYMPKWIKRGMDFDEKRNPDLTKAIYKAHKSLTKSHKKIIEFRHVRSHNKNNWQSSPGNSYEYFCWTNNDYVDRLCGYARKKLKPDTHKKLKY